ncbi:MAG TPA: amino acid adenylation domain-containing protein, partial [Longimicrobiaceae bacterium]|nr:amino acid adenylation domain-containing protein [Longimicrobiaceae bacterium]
GAESAGSPQSGRGEREHLLDVRGVVAGGRLRVQWSYGEGVHLRATVEGVAERFGAELRGLIEHCRSEEAGGYTPSDFPLAQVGQEALDGLLGRERGVEDLYPLSPLQEGLLFHTLYEPGSSAYMGQTGFEIRGDLDVEAFRRAWEGVLERHSALRAAFAWEKVERPLQVVRRRVALPLREEDWRGMSGEEQRAGVAAYLAGDREQGMDLSRAPLMRLALFRTDERVHQIVWTHHHAILDGWSLPILFRDVLLLYEGVKRGEAVELAEARPYRDYVAWLERQDMAGAERFWREELAGFTTPTVLDPAEPRAPGDRGEDREYHLALSPGATRSLRELAQRERLTLNTVVQGAWALLLSRYAGEEDVLFGATVSGRPADLEGVEGMVGLFINTLPVRVRARPEARLVEWLKELQARQAELRDYEHTPLVQVQGWSEVPAGQPFFESILVFQNYPLDEMLQQREWELEIRTTTIVEEGNYHPLMLAVVPGAELSLKMEYDPERYGAAAIERLVGQLRVLLEGIAGDPDRRLADLPLLGKAERERVLAEWNGTAEYFPKTCIHELITAQAARTPYAPAAVHEGEHLAYAELDRRSSQLANHLRGLGVGPEVRVALCLERGLATAVAILGVLKAGGAYVPLDADYPAERLAYMLGDCDAPVLLTQERLRGLLPENSAEVVCLDTGWPGIARESSEPPRSGVGPQNLAYVIYTSGSTGRPKGVQIEHRALVQFASSMVGRLGLTPADRVLQFASPAFDVVVEELFPAWLSGAAVVFPGGDLLDPGQLLKVVERERVTAFELPTAYWHEWVYERVRSEGRLPGHVRFVIVGGERVVPERLAEWSRLGVPLVHVFGLTETAVTSTTLRLEAGDDGSRWPNLPVGTPIPNTRIYVLDTSLNPVPPGMAGELYVGGEGVARGYLGRPDLTAARFVPDSFAAEPGGCLYRTGDRVRWLADGNLEFLGRIDLQVKVRGHRIEPAEIEAVLARHPAVREAVVMVREDTSGDRRLVAYMVPARGFVPADDGLRVCTPESGVERVTAADLYRFVERELPSYMVPTTSVFLQDLPLTPNGKLDRRALPAPQWYEGEGSYVPPRTPVEEVLAGIWAEVLRTERVGVHDNFFALGGHSLLAMRVISQVRERLAAEVPIRTMFEGPTVAELASRVESYHMELPVDAEGLEERLAELEGLSEEELRLLLEQG